MECPDVTSYTLKQLPALAFAFLLLCVYLVRRAYVLMIPPVLLLPPLLVSQIFPLGNKWVLIGSLLSTNQWWVGTLSGNPPRFTPETVGIMDYGNGYAAKTGSSFVQSGSSRRVVFGFTGWIEPTQPQYCGRYLITPRELTIGANNELQIEPIPEVARLRVPGTKTHAAVVHATDSDVTDSAALLPGAELSRRLAVTTLMGLAKGSQVEVRVNCTPPGSG